MGVGSAPLIVFWLVVGAAVGALIAALVARVQLVAVRREHAGQLKRRENVIASIKDELDERREQMERQEERLQELDGLRRERAALAGDLEQARKALADAQAALDAARATARETELRLEAERQEAIARRAASATELAAAQEAVLKLRTELSAAREASSRAEGRLEADLSATRALLERTAQELQQERAAASEARAELTRRVAALEDDRNRLETELSQERRANAEKQASLRSFVSTLREQYALACAERDAAAREAAAQRARADEAEAALERTRAEFAQRLDHEHNESVELISRVWDYVHAYPRLRDRPVHGPPPPPPQAAEPKARPADLPPEPEPEPAPAELPPPPPFASDREVQPERKVVADAPRAEREYDIERELAAAPARPKQPTTPVTGPIKVRRPVSAMRREHDVLVICDDGSVWTKRPSGWTQEKPIPGSEVDLSEEPGAEPDRPR